MEFWFLVTPSENNVFLHEDEREEMKKKREEKNKDKRNTIRYMCTQ